MFPFKKKPKWASSIHWSIDLQIEPPSLRFPYSTSLFAPRRQNAAKFATRIRHREKVQTKTTEPSSGMILQVYYSPESLTCPLKIDGWKIYSLRKMVTF